MTAELEVAKTVEAMIKNLASLAERNPEASVKGDEFNALLRRARTAFPQSEAIHDLKEIDTVTTLADLFGKLSMIEGAVKATFTARTNEAIRRHNLRQREQW